MFQKLLLAILCLGACDAEDPFQDPDATFDTIEAPAADAEDADRVRPTLWSTCGDPVCRGWTPKPMPRCTNFTEGHLCPPRAVGRSCDPVSPCNNTLVCGYSSPIGSGGCPISRAKYKRDIAYLSDAQTDAMYQTVRSVKLANWIYKDDVAAAPHTGFIIDDMVPGSPAVAADGDHVDLYGYASMSVAAIQAQARRIDQLERELAEIKAALAAQTPATAGR